MDSRRQDERKNSTTANVVSMLSAGLVSNTFTHPLSVASHNAVKHKRSFLAWINFRKPFSGYLPTLIYGPVLSGEYFFLQDSLNEYLKPLLVGKMEMSEVKANFTVTEVAGALYGLTSGPLNAVQRHVWNNPGYTFYYSARTMYKEAGLYPFYKGITASSVAGAVFSGTYQVIRSSVNSMIITPQNQTSLYATVPGNTVAAMVASVVASPLYYVRFMQQITEPAEQQRSMVDIVKSTWNEMPPKHKLLSRLSFLCTRLDFCPMALRAGLGVTVGQTIYDVVRNTLDGQADESSPTSRLN